MRRKWKAAKAGRRRGRWCVGSSGFQPLCVWGRGRKFGMNKWCERKRGTVQRCCWCRWANSALEQPTCQPFCNQPLMIFGPRDTCWSLYLKKQLQSFVGFSSVLPDEKPRGCVMSDTWLASESAKQFWRLSWVFVCECESVCVSACQCGVMRTGMHFSPTVWGHFFEVRNVAIILSFHFSLFCLNGTVWNI